MILLLGGRWPSGDGEVRGEGPARDDEEGHRSHLRVEGDPQRASNLGPARGL